MGTLHKHEIGLALASRECRQEFRKSSVIYVRGPYFQENWVSPSTEKRWYLEASPQGRLLDQDQGLRNQGSRKSQFAKLLRDLLT